MDNTELHSAISNAFYNLSQNNTCLYDFWLSELYASDGELVRDKWNEHTLKLMETDVMNQLN